MSVKFTLRQLEYFVAVGNSGSIAGASDQVNISPAAISSAISQLEDLFGIELFVRQHAQGLKLTPGGRRFFKVACVLLENAEELYDVANEIAEQVRGPINVGCLVSVAPFVLPESRRSFVEQFPEVIFHQIEAHQVDLFNMLRRAEIDIAITYDLELPHDIEFLPVTELPPYALFAPSHPLSNRDSVSLKELAEIPLILLDLPLSREYFFSLFLEKKLRPIIAERTASLPMVRTMVANEFGYGLLNIPSKNQKALDGKQVSYVPLEKGLRPMQLGLITMASERRSRIMDAFIDHISDQLSNYPMP
ncbi:MAG: LysR substrate-binding domain-containing protein [bacterium]